MRAALVLVAITTFGSSAFAADPNPQALDFFEKKIRPALTQHCYSCHSADAEKNKKLKGSLFLDTRAGWQTGGDTGPAIVPGKPGESLLIETLKYDGDVQMPPKGKLPDAVIADFVKWVEMGAPDPRTGGPKKQVGLSIEAGRQFWSYKTVQNPPVPPVQNTAWPKSDIDRFILAKIEAAKLKPAPDADRATLARRVYFDLIGLPPTPEEVDAFVKDTSPNALEKLVDRLLASPQFGERWGRHWLDVVRYADSITLRGTIFKEAWRYRDYVVDTFNTDAPFDRFIREQIAGDLLPAPTPDDRRRQLIATSFLQLGNTNLEEQDKKQLRMDVVDEMLDVVSKGFLGQTVTCARCHDHKFDPIPTKDYYALAGILRNVKALETANVSKWIEVPLPAPPEQEAAIAKHDAAIAELQARIKTLKAKKPAAAAKGGILPVSKVPGIAVDDADAKKVGDWTASKFSGHYIGEGYIHDANTGKGEKTVTFDPELPATGRYEVRLAYAPGENRSTAVPVTVFSADGEKTITVDMKQNPPIDGRFISLGVYRFEKTGQSFVIVSNEDTKGHVTADAITFIPVAEGNGSTTDRGAQKEPPISPEKSDDVAALEAELKRLQQSGPKRQLTMSVIEEKVIEDAKVHVRGSVHNLGELAPRGFLQVATVGPTPTFSTTESGRRELADWIASKNNPLTARVTANRVWYWLLGDGIVRTVDNFGTTGELPSHPELLDYLATRFVDNGWSMKKLIREIVLSRTYQQSSELRNAGDPENRLFAHANRRRLDAESVRDTMLHVSGKLTLDPGGFIYSPTLAADYGYKANSYRRSLYLPVFRNSLPDIFEVFDFADPSLVVGRRTTSTVAPQALYLMNNPFVVEQSQFTAARLLEEKHADDAARITRLYRLALGREPSPGERDLASRFLKSSTDTREAWAALVQTVFASADFRYAK